MQTSLPHRRPAGLFLPFLLNFDPGLTVFRAHLAVVSRWSADTPGLAASAMQNQLHDHLAAKVGKDQDGEAAQSPDDGRLPPPAIPKTAYQ